MITKEKSNKLKWIVEFSVDKIWISDGFDLTEERALDMLANDLRYAHIDTELGAKIIQKPSQRTIRKLQGYI